MGGEGSVLFKAALAALTLLILVYVFRVFG